MQSTKKPSLDELIANATDRRSNPESPKGHKPPDSGPTLDLGTPGNGKKQECR